MADPRITKFATVLVEHSARVVSGDRILLEGTTAAEPLLRELYIQILENGGHPHLMMTLPGLMLFSQEEMYLTYAKDTQLDFVPTFYKLAYEQFEGRIRIHSATNTHGTTNIDPTKIQRYHKAISSITEAQFRRGGDGSFKWVTTLYPTDGYASGCPADRDSNGNAFTVIANSYPDGDFANGPPDCCNVYSNPTGNQSVNWFSPMEWKLWTL